MKYTLITGASSGIGYEFANVFASKKHNLILVARSGKKLDDMKHLLERKYNIKVVAIAMDLAAINAAKKLYEETSRRGYIVNNLVNNAGFGDWIGFIDSDWERQADMIQLNITTLTQMTYLYANEMRKHKEGHILNLSSAAAFFAGPYMANYYATKGYVLSFSQAVAYELRKTGVTVTAFCPGPTATGFGRAANMKGSNMFRVIKPANSKAVAKCGYQGMMKGKIVVYHGAPTKLMNIGSRLLPRCIATDLAKKVNAVPRKKG